MKSVIFIVLLLSASIGHGSGLERTLHAERVSKSEASRNTDKEITVGCLTTPIPTTPTGPTWTYELNAGSTSTPEIVRGTFWRKPCAAANDAQLVLTFTPVSGSPFVCTGLRAVLIQNSQQTDDFFFDTSPNSTNLDTFCGDLFVTTSVVIDERSTSFTFDDDAAFTFINQGGSSAVPTATINVGAYDPAAYGQSAQLQPISGKLSGSYYDPARNGEGVLVEVGRLGTRKTMFLTWYTYSGGAQRWVAGNIDFAGGATAITIPLITTTGGQFGAAFNPSQVQVSNFGSATVTFPTCTTMRFQWSESGGQSGLYNYQRLVEGLEGVVCP